MCFCHWSHLETSCNSLQQSSWCSQSLMNAHGSQELQWLLLAKRSWEDPVSPRAATRCQCHSVSSEIRTKITRLQVARINGKNGRADPNKCEAEVLAATKTSLNSKHMINDPVIALIGMNVLLTSWPANCGSLHVFFTSIASQWAEVV